MKFTSYIHEGGRKYNEDFLDSRYKDKIYCFVVADGFGPEGTGAVAAKLAVSSILDAFEAAPKLAPESLRAYITEAQRALLIKKSESAQFGDIGTTVAVLMTDGSDALWASVGDTRIYIYKGAQIIEVSEDHSVSFEKFAKGEIEFADIRIDSDANKLRRALGDRIAWEPDISEVFPISSSHSFLICTDGFWRSVLENEMERARMFSLSSKGWLDKMLKKIAPRLGRGSDNLSAVAITMQHSDSL